MAVSILQGDSLQMLQTLPSGSVQCVVTSPPYWGLRDYGVEGQLGLEPTPEEYVAKMVAVFREVRRVLRDDGTLWLNLGDSYAGSNCGSNDYRETTGLGARPTERYKGQKPGLPASLKPKDLVGIPWRVAFALQANGWWLRSDIIWHKPNPMPESVKDRCTKAHEYVFMLTRSACYYFDSNAIREPVVSVDDPRVGRGRQEYGGKYKNARQRAFVTIDPNGRNRRDVWAISTKPYSGAHFAVMPPDLAEICIKAGSAEGDTVLDPFGGAGTTGLVADRLGRNAILIELNPEYCEMARKRIESDAGMWARVNTRRGASQGGQTWQQ